MNDSTFQIIALYDGKRTSVEIASIVGLSARYVRKIAQRLDLDRLGPGAMDGDRNHQFVCGRRVDLDGYVLVTAPNDHPYARKRPHRNGKIIFEHRLVLEQELGRYLLPEEVVDHIDGLTLHNDPLNLRLFYQNSEHLRETTTGLQKKISVSGKKNIQSKHRQPEDFRQIDTYSRRRERGDVRLRQILLAALKLGKGSPFLLGTTHHLRKARIDTSSYSMIKLALDDLMKRWDADLLL